MKDEGGRMKGSRTTVTSPSTIHYPPSTRSAGSWRLAAAAAILLAAGCADLRWHKDGADAAALERDLGECQQQARAQAARESWSHGISNPPVIGVDAQGRAILSQPGRIDADRFLIEHDLSRACMRGRGYELVPVEKR